MTLKNDTMRLCAVVPRCLDLKFSYNASRIFLFKKGWKSLAVIEAVKIWIWLVNNDEKLYKQLKENIKEKPIELTFKEES